MGFEAVSISSVAGRFIGAPPTVCLRPPLVPVPLVSSPPVVVVTACLGERLLLVSDGLEERRFSTGMPTFSNRVSNSCCVIVDREEAAGESPGISHHSPPSNASTHH